MHMMGAVHKRHPTWTFEVIPLKIPGLSATHGPLFVAVWPMAAPMLCLAEVLRYGVMYGRCQVGHVVVDAHLSPGRSCSAGSCGKLRR